MHKHAIVVLLSMLFCTSPRAQQRDILNTTSPQLRKFAGEHPAAAKILTNAFSNSFSGKTIRLFYFYSDDKSVPQAGHFYPGFVGEADVFIYLQADQSPLDEFITLLFETLNTKGEARFAKLCEDARSGTISRTEFAKGILKVEFEAAKGVHELLPELKLSKRESQKSYYFRAFRDCPSDFEDFLVYTKHLSPDTDRMKAYESRYDLLRNTP